MSNFIGKKIIWFIIGFGFLPLLVFVIRFCNYNFSDNPDDWYKVLNVIYSMLIFLATSLIGYFAYRFNTIKPFIDRYVDAYNEISQYVSNEMNIIPIKIMTNDITDVRNQVDHIRIKMLSYQKKYKFLFPEVNSIIDNYIERLTEAYNFYNSYLVDKEFDQKLSSETQKLSKAYEDFINDLKNSVIKIG